MTTADIDLEWLRNIRARDPEAVLRAAEGRRRRDDLLGNDGRLMIIAADHPARGAVAVGDDVTAMADREELLRRLVAALARPGVDGVLGTPDVIEDLLLLGALDDRVVIGSMNRGGLAGSTFELDDRFTGYDAATIAAMRFDGGKMLVRIDVDDPATVGTLEAVANAVTELAQHGVLAMVEPFISRRIDGKVHNDLSAEAVVRSVGIASGLGTSSRHTWLKLPVVDRMEEVVTSTTLPVLLLGGDPDEQPDEYFAKWRAALALPGVRGLIVGRTLLYPPDGDIAAAVDPAVEMVHGTAEVPA